MGILKNHLKKDIRFQKGDLILYEPNEIQREELINILKDKLSYTGEGSVKGNINIRYIYRELTSIGNEIDELTDEEFEELVDENNDKYDRDIDLLHNEIIFLIDEISEDLIYENIKQTKTVKSMINILNSNDEAEVLKNKLDKFFKKKKIKITADEIIQKGMASDELKQIIENANKDSKNKKVK